MLAFWLCLVALTASPELHRLVHQDAQSSTHHCLITQIQHQSLLAGFVPVLVPAAPLADFGSARFFDGQSIPAVDYRLLPSRAPPFAYFFAEDYWLEAGA